ncbi:NAD(+) diphosphatase [Aspergillus puulaauensis]|uniref:NAD(+) diphosphatase n=1 Tax=Aspergillus puulaauensis TaxID=1220207 RepID=A0A7R8AFR7_9EURO|nr:NADH pyrophosphatase [Aspergillus puulaauensis]BCS17201.1 NADH pyrophosphatase [Aspergillus puulaauensis]
MYTPKTPNTSDTTVGYNFSDREIVNYFSDSPLNRVSFLRTEPEFLSLALKHPTAQFLLFNNLAPLTRSPTEIYYAKHDEISQLVPEDTFKQSEEELIKGSDARDTHAAVIFLGLRTCDSGSSFSYKIYSGAPFFAVDVTPEASRAPQDASLLIKSMEEQGLFFHQTRVLNTLPGEDAAIYAQARSLVDWNTRNRFCGICSGLTVSVNAGTKRVCLSSNKIEPNLQLKCSIRTIPSNLCFPRTDPTIISVVLSADGKRVLLGRGKRAPPKRYSALAGFIEPGESVENAVRREVWEEAGVILSRVSIHSTQPWPYPANLMIGAIGQCHKDHEDLTLEHDHELADARWYKLEEVRDALNGTGDLQLPPATAIANQMLRSIVKSYFCLDG